MPLTEIIQPISTELEQFNQHMLDYSNSQVPLVRTITQHIVENSGKHLRPIIHLLTAKALNYQGDSHIKLATMLEYIHTATLLHDDVVDASELRRGQSTANMKWGNEASILTGDFLYARAFKLIVQAQSPQVLLTVAEATERIAEAEALQLSRRYNTELSETQYLHIIHGKTGELFALASTLAGLISKLDQSQYQALHAFGMHLGTAFQLVDDALDYCGTAVEMGKNRGDDLEQGHLTLPLIVGLQEGDSKLTRPIKESIDAHQIPDFNQIQTVIEQTSAINHTLEKAKAQSQLAQEALLGVLPDCPCRQSLIALSEFAIERKH